MTELFSSTRKFKAIIEESLLDVRGFGAFFAFMIFQFSLIKSQLKFPDKFNLIDETGIVFAEILGGFDTPGVGVDRVWGVWDVFIMMMIYINLIGLNSLIALLGDSYGKVQSNFDMYDIVLRLGLLIDFH